LPRKATTFFHLQFSDCPPLHSVCAKIVFQDGGAFLLAVVKGHAAGSSPSALFGCTLRGLTIIVGFGFTSPRATGSSFWSLVGALWPFIRASCAATSAAYAAFLFSRLLWVFRQRGEQKCCQVVAGRKSFPHSLHCIRHTSPFYF